MLEEIQKTIVEAKDEIRQQYKSKVKGIFGSYTWGDFHAHSDLDLLVDFYGGANLLDLVGLQQFLEDKLGCEVDVVSRRSLREEIRTSAFNDMIYL